MKKIEELSDWRDGLNTVLHGDCLDLMRMMPDKCIDLVLTDPPYGINAGTMTMGRGSRNDRGKNKKKEWDNTPPAEEIFEEIFRISKYQIVWGGNYFDLPPSRCFLLWDKLDYHSDFASHELAWTSFDAVVKCFRRARNAGNEWKKHPTQKPLELGRWCLENYGKGCKTIFDPFAGSFTFARAAKDMGFDFLACDREEDYCRIGEERLKQECLF